jgi:sporulation protein YlmC with PRC-barrel domain
MPGPHPAGVMASMRLDLGSPVRCADGDFGTLADVVIDPTTRRVTHLVVQPEHDPGLARLVPIARAGTSETAIELDCTIDDVHKLEPVHEVAFLRLGELRPDDPDWDVGVEDVMALPYYSGVYASEPLDLGRDVTISYDRIPKGEVEIRRSSAVFSDDDHHLGHVDGFVVDDEHITHVLLERGHLWGRREVAIPIGEVARVENDVVTLRLSKDAVGDLPSHHVSRWRSR